MKKSHEEVIGHPPEEQNLYSFAFSSIHSSNKHLLHCYHMLGPMLSAVGRDKTQSLFTGIHNVLRESKREKNNYVTM